MNNMHNEVNMTKSNTLYPNKTLTYSILTALSVLLLAGCGGTGQDDGSSRNFSQTYSGVAVDGYLARATVFVDSNNNGTRDAWEAWAFTDNDGYYSFNPRTNTDYCATDATAQQRQYCLISNVEYSNVVIRIDSGYDIITGEPFLGQMSRRVNAQVQDEVSDSVVSPITSLLTNVENSNDRNAILGALDITEDDLDVDYLNADGSDAVNAQLLNTALKIHKVVAVLSDRLTDTYTEIGEDFGTPNDASSAVYPNLAEQIIAAGTNLDNALSDETTLVSALDAAENSLREVYERREFTLPADLGSVSNPSGFERVVEVASEFSAVVNSLINTEDSAFNQDDTTAATNALEVLVLKTVEEKEDDSSIDNLINFFDPEDSEYSENLVDSLLSSLTSESADLKGLTNNDFDFETTEEIDNAASLGTDVTAFSGIGGRQIKVSDLDLGHGPNDLDDGEVEFYFNGDPGDTEGSFQACVKYIEGANIDGTLGDGNTRGELVSGFWSMLGATGGNAETHSLLITITFLGTTYQAIMKPAGTETVDSVEYERIRFDFNDQLKFWHSAQGFTDITNIPSTNQECEARLPSRIGI